MTSHIESVHECPHHPSTVDFQGTITLHPKVISTKTGSVQIDETTALLPKAPNAHKRLDCPMDSNSKWLKSIWNSQTASCKNELSQNTDYFMRKYDKSKAQIEGDKCPFPFSAFKDLTHTQLRSYVYEGNQPDEDEVNWLDQDDDSVQRDFERSIFIIATKLQQECYPDVDFKVELQKMSKSEANDIRDMFTNGPKVWPYRYPSTN